MYRRLRWLPVLLMIVLGSTQAATRDPGEFFFDQGLGNFNEELEIARDEGKKGVLIMFEMDECPFCHRMKNRVLNQIAVQDYFKDHFLIQSGQHNVAGVHRLRAFDGVADRDSREAKNRRLFADRAAVGQRAAGVEL